MWVDIKGRPYVGEESRREPTPGIVLAGAVERTEACAVTGEVVGINNQGKKWRQKELFRVELGRRVRRLTESS